MKLERIYLLVSDKAVALQKNFCPVGELQDAQGVIFFRDRSCLLAPVPFRRFSSSTQPLIISGIGKTEEDEKDKKNDQRGKDPSILSEAERDLVEKNLPLVSALARRKNAASTLPWDDRIQAGSIGLIKAVQDLDPKRVGAWVTFASICIVNAMREASYEDRLIKKPPHLAQLLNNILDIEGQLMQRLDRSPTIDEIIEALPNRLYRSGKIKAALATEHVTSLDFTQPDHDDSDSLNLYDLIAGPEGSTEEQVLRKEEISATEQRDQYFHREIGHLHPRLQLLIRLYYTEGRTARQISGLMGISESRVCQLHQKILEQLRTSMALRNHMGDDVSLLVPSKHGYNHSQEKK